MRFRLRDALTLAKVTSNAVISADQITGTRFFGLRYVLRMWALALVPMLVIGFVLVTAYIIAGSSPPRPRLPSSASFFIFGNLVFAPLVETAIMFPIIYLIMLFFHRPIYVAAVSGALWGLLHAVFTWPLGLLAAWLGGRYR
jgi:hypothetical protein